jgi:hypothetical protein
VLAPGWGDGEAIAAARAQEQALDRHQADRGGGGPAPGTALVACVAGVTAAGDVIAAALLAPGRARARSDGQLPAPEV